jgi:tellurite resistance protein
MRPALGFACSVERIVPRGEVRANGVTARQAGDCPQKWSTHFLTVMRNSEAFNEATPRVPIAQHHS